MSGTLAAQPVPGGLGQHVARSRAGSCTVEGLRHLVVGTAAEVRG